MRRRLRVENERDGLRDVDVVTDREALRRRERAHHRQRLGDVRVPIAVHERQPEHAHVEAVDRQEEALGGELAHGIGGDRCALVGLAREAATVRTVDQARAREDEALDRRRDGGACEVLRAEIIHGVRLLGGGATEEGRAVHHSVEAVHGSGQRARVEQIAFDELDLIAEHVLRAAAIAHEGAYLIAARGEPFGEARTDFSCCSRDENSHGSSVGSRGARRLEKPDIRP